MAEIKLTQLKAKDPRHIIEWIEYDKFEDVEYLAKGGFGTTFKAVWKDGNILRWNYDNNQWKRNGETKVALKCLYNSQGITADFLKEVESNILVYHSDPLKRPNAYELSRLFYGLWAAINSSKVDSVIYRQVKETDDINKNLSSSMDQPPLSSTSNLLYTTHPQAVYTSSLLDFKNLPEPKNADNTDLEYSDSLKMDFTKLDINSKDGGN
ncbi:kinase-like domain-containing protein [Rhizophagus irregularis DAOM 181602=DAOM 197198]|nr:kinase-like domain-containing protein [Rhizophagus irregularis DAOM 181602=DAOM 197198]